MENEDISSHSSVFVPDTQDFSIDKGNLDDITSDSSSEGFNVRIFKFLISYNIDLWWQIQCWMTSQTVTWCKITSS